MIKSQGNGWKQAQEAMARVKEREHFATQTQLMREHSQILLNLRYNERQNDLLPLPKKD